MTMQWQYTSHGKLGVLSLSGYLGAEAACRLAGALGWTLVRGSGPLIVDLGALTGWSAEGQDTVREAAIRLAVHDRPMELAGAPGGDIVAVFEVAQRNIAVYPDLASALAAHGIAPQQPGGHRWCTTDWREGTSSPDRPTGRG